ncbi:2653_t:CDS:10 [Ambispora gerdemannii]|uniref:2653_t:CDS:1 n=1 Tax=Ambispora gerdemannii TaxID=144530 RepID=A0A9N9AG56_9GLOM|nr:2653_t:CDS:10 [Ambispora gerdemannii]
MSDDTAEIMTSYTEEISGFQFFGSYTGRDGTILLRLVRKSNKIACDYPDEPQMHFRVVHPTWKVDKIDLSLKSLNISITNFCPTDYILIYLLEPEAILFTYFDFKTKNPFSTKTYNEIGVIISYAGEILTQFPMGESTLNRDIAVSGKYNGGFLRVFMWPANQTIAWTRVSTIIEKREFNVRKGIFYTPKPKESIQSFTIIPKLDGEFGCAITTFNNEALDAISSNTTNVTTAEAIYYFSLTVWKVYVTFLLVDSDQPTNLFTLYETSTIWRGFSADSCSVQYFDSELVCFLVPIYRDIPFYGFYVRFTSEGAVNSTRAIWFHNITDWKFEAFTASFSGGFRVHGMQNDIAVIDIYNISGEYNNTLKISAHYTMYPNNNCLWFIKSNGPQEWHIKTLKFPNFIQYDERFQNPDINTTVPDIGQTISLRTRSLTITYNSKVNLSTGNVSIYKYDSDLLRQETFALGNIAQYDPLVGYTNVTIDVFKSTFNQPDTEYYVMVNTGFVERPGNHEAIYGIERNIWHFKTESNFKDTHADTASGLLRLSVNGTNDFETAYYSSGGVIIEDLAKQIAEIIPVSSSRITISNKYQYDPNSHPSQILLRMSIGQAVALNESDIPDVIEDFQELLEYSQFNGLSRQTYTSWLDNTYKFVPTDDFWNRYKIAIFVVCAAFILLISLYLFARYKNREANNFVILNLVIILQDFVFDVLFVVQNGRDFEVLFIPSVLTLIVPIFLNGTAALFILLSENSREDKFNDWFRKFPQIASIFTIFACADVEFLSVLSSQIFGLDIFSAVFSERAENFIFWASCINILIEDLPQFIIRLIYWRQNITYDILPNIALVSGAVGLLAAVLGRMYQITVRCAPRKYQRTSNPGTTDG